MARISSWIWVLPLVLAGCAGAPTTYLSLDAAPPAQFYRLAGGPPVAISQFALPPQIDRLHFVTRTGPATLHVAGGAEWAGPLDGLARIALAQDLAARLQGVNVLMPGDPVPPGGVMQVVVNVQIFSADARGRITLAADYSFRPPAGQGAPALGRFAVTLGGEPEPGAEAQTMSQALGRLADALARAMAIHA